MSADASEVFAYANHLEQAITTAEPELAKITERGALNIKRNSRGRLRGISRRHYLKHYYRSLSYDVDDDGLGAEIGPDASKLQGKMGRGVELGSVHTQPFPHLFPSLDEEEPKYLDQVSRAIIKALK